MPFQGDDNAQPVEGQALVRPQLRAAQLSFTRLQKGARDHQWGRKGLLRGIRGWTKEILCQCSKVDLSFFMLNPKHLLQDCLSKISGSTKTCNFVHLVLHRYRHKKTNLLLLYLIWYFDFLDNNQSLFNKIYLSPVQPLLGMYVRGSPTVHHPSG